MAAKSTARDANRLIARIITQLAMPVSGASLGALRIVFGCVMLYEALWFLGLTPNAPRSPSVIGYWYTGPDVAWTFSVFGFELLQPMPAWLMTALFVLLAVCSAFVTLGVLYRVAITTIAVGFSYVFLLEAAFYQNHFYLACLIAWLLVVVPADRCLSVRVLWLQHRQTVRPDHVPSWNIYLLRAQLFLVYFYAGLAKLNPDWLAGEPLRSWLRQPEIALFLEPVLSANWLGLVRAGLASETAVWLMSYGGLCFDLAIGFMLLGRRTRLLGMVLVVLFHSINFCIFPIGAFPVLAIGLTLIFLDADWPSRLWSWIRRPSLTRPDLLWSLFGAFAVPPVGVLLGWRPRRSPPVHQPAEPVGWGTVSLIAVWLTWQVLTPLRHYAIPGNVSWTEEGHRFSWQMMLRAKESGPFRIEIQEAAARPVSGDSWQALGDSHPRRYHQFTNDEWFWADQPELVLTYEPLLGERIIFNPLAGDNWGQAATRARRHWQQTYGSPPAFHRTWPLREALLQIRMIESTGLTAASQQLNDIDRVLYLNDRMRQTSLKDAARQRHALELQDALYGVVARSKSRQKVLAILMQTTPFALQGHVHDRSPFMVVISPEMTGWGRHSAVRIKREKWNGEPSVLIDLTRLSPLQMRSLPRVIAFDDFFGRETAFWNYAVDLHKGQYDLLRRCPRSQCQYAERIALLWNGRYGLRPQLYVTSYVQLNHHPMKLMVDPNTDLAAVRWQPLTGNRWIMPFNAGGTVTAATVASRQPVKDGIE